MGNQKHKKIQVKQWAKIICERCGRGLYVDEYCEQHGISRNQYYYWLREVKEAQSMNACRGSWRLLLNQSYPDQLKRH